MTTPPLPTRKQVPFSQIIAVVAEARTQIRAGASLNTVIRPVLLRLPPDSRPATQALIYESVRHTAETRALIQRLCARQPTPAVQSLLEGAFAAFFLGRTAPFTIVSETVTAAKNQQATRGAAGFINAVLRRFQREKAFLLQDISAEEEVRYNAPRWWINYIRQIYPGEAENILTLVRRHPPLILRVNLRHTTMDDYTALLEAHQLAYRQVGLEAVELLTPVPVEQIPGFKEGACSVQDAGTQLAAHLLPVAAGDRVLDACAAPGGKTAHILERADCNMTALEIDPQRSVKIQDTLSRLNLSAHVKTADATDLAAWWDGQPYDAILLDAPCTASGVVRRQPDTPWLRRASDIKQLATEQRKLLKTLWPLLKPQGKMLYATCSIFPEEGTQQILRFLADTPDAALVPMFPGNDGMLTLLPEEAKAYVPKTLLPSVHDGFFYALLEKKS